MKGRVLVVEDNPMNLEIACELLDDAGFETYKAVSAAEGLALARKHYPDVILMDLHLPDKTGFETTVELKSSVDEALRRIPVVAFTAQAMEEEQRKAVTAGCVGIISKPIDIDEFALLVEGFIHSEESPARGQDLGTDEPAIVVPQSDRVLAKLLHDLKTPVQAEFTALQILLSEKNGPLTLQQRELLEEMVNANQDAINRIHELTGRILQGGLSSRHPDRTVDQGS